jgi:hypothetical protein
MHAVTRICTHAHTRAQHGHRISVGMVDVNELLLRSIVDMLVKDAISVERVPSRDLLDNLIDVM